MVAAEREGVKMKRDVLAFLVRTRLRRFGRLGGRRPSWDASQASHSEGLWKNHTECRESMDTHKVLMVGGGLTALAPGSSRSLFNSGDFPRSAEEGSPPLSSGKASSS